MNEPKKPHMSRWMLVGLVFMGIASFSGIATMITISIGKIRSGKGLDIYRTTWLAEFNYVGMLVLFSAAVVALMVGGFFRYREYRQWRGFEEKYSADKDRT